MTETPAPESQAVAARSWLRSTRGGGLGASNVEPRNRQWLHFRRLLFANASIAAIVVLVVLAVGLEIRHANPLAMASGIALLAAVYGVYTCFRRDDRIASLAASIILIACFTHAGGACTYAVASLGLPLADHYFAAIDAVFGFDWLRYFAWSASSPLIAGVLRFAYDSSLAQIIGACIALAMTRRIERLTGFLWLFILTGSAVTILSALLPAVGAVVFHDPPQSVRLAIGMDAGVWHLQQFHGLRDGSLRVIDFSKMEGIVTFPSFHTSLAIMCIWAFWPFRLLKWPILLLNSIVIAATPSIGGHYLIDTIAGGLAAWLAIYVLPAVLGRRTQSLANPQDPTAGRD